jgi:hypothetical protein
MLVPERYFEVHDLFTVALKAEMPGFDDSRVNRTDGDLVNLVTFDAIVIHDADGLRSVLFTTEDVLGLEVVTLR